MQSNELKKLLSRKEAAAVLGVSKSTLDCWACSGRYALPVVKVGRRSMYSPDDLAAFIHRQRTGTTE